MDIEYLFESIRISKIEFIGATETLTTVWGLMVGLPVLALITRILGGIIMKKLNESLAAAVIVTIVAVLKLLWNNNEQTQQEFDDACGFLATKVYNLVVLSNSLIVEPCKKVPGVLLQGLILVAQLAIDIIAVSVLVPFLVTCFVAFKCYDFGSYLWGATRSFVTDCRDKISEIKAAKEAARTAKETADKEVRLNTFVSEFGDVIEELVQARLNAFISESNKKEAFIRKHHGLKVRQLRNIMELLSLPYGRSTTKLQSAEALWDYAQLVGFARVNSTVEHVIPAAQEEQAHV